MGPSNGFDMECVIFVVVINVFILSLFSLFHYFTILFPLFGEILNEN